MSAELKVVKDDQPTEFDKQLERIDRPDFVKRELTPPYFPDHENLRREVVNGTLKSWFARLVKPADGEPIVNNQKK